MGEMADMAIHGMQTRIIVGVKGSGERIFADGRPDYSPPPTERTALAEPVHWRRKPPTARQWAGVKLIYRELGYTTRAKTRGGVADFLSKHLDDAKIHAQIERDYSYFDDDSPGGKYE